jgi:DNA-binding Lrp family transcriptional regulator
MVAMEVRAGYREAHLMVAAIRVLAHQADGRPPTVEEVAESLGLSREWAGVLAASLEREGILRALTGPFETRLEIRDHLALEKLPRGETSAGVDEELREFSAKKKEEEETLHNLFSSGDALKKREEQMGKMADNLKRFKGKASKSSPLFKEDPAEGE